MAFTLRITFSGLCLFVPEPVGGPTRGRMHVLMPGMFGHPYDVADRHTPALGFDVGHTVRGGPLLGFQALAKLTGYALTLAGDGADLRLCSHIVDLREVTGRSVDPDLLGADSQNRLVSRVTLGGGRITRVAPGVCWEWAPGEFRPIAHQVEWEIPGMKGDSLTLAAQAIGGGAAPMPLGTLYPVDGRVSLVMYHETQQDLPPDPLPAEHQHPPMLGESPRHFAAYYALFGGPVPIRMPKYWGRRDDCPKLAGGCEPLPSGMGGMPFACLVAGVSP
ncbi:MAG: hypothetical protein ACJ8GN_02955 [Longimicrobiaceae bacterium]